MQEMKHLALGLVASQNTWAAGIAMLLLSVTACHMKQTASMTSFLQSDKKTLVEVRDRESHSWKILTVSSPNTTAYLLVNSENRVDLIASAFVDKAGVKHALVFVDENDKQEALAILDRKFLLGVSGASDEYRKWAEQNVIFTYGSAQVTRTMDLKRGGFGGANIRVDGGKIIAQINEANCHCYQLAMSCAGLPSPYIACVNKFCDLVNCVIGVLNGSGHDCQQEGSDAKTTCELAVGEPQ
jgi:hypothetical protein